jgi:hypothetical protein
MDITRYWPRKVRTSRCLLLVSAIIIRVATVSISGSSQVTKDLPKDGAVFADVEMEGRETRRRCPFFTLFLLSITIMVY